MGQVSEQIINMYACKSLTLKDFLTIYEDIIRVSYLFELLDSYNTKKVSTDAVKKYIERNDYLLAGDEKYAELTLKLPNGFYLDDYEGLAGKLGYITSGTPEFIPSVIPSLSGTAGISKPKAAEIELQCLKNNLRLKTNILLYFLNLTALANAKARGIPEIKNKMLSELF